MFTSNEPIIRLSRPNDLNRVTTLDLKCYPYPKNLKYWKEFFEGIGKTSKILVLERLNKAIGFTAWDMHSDKSTGEEFATISRFGVMPEHRRKGFGTLMLEATQRHAELMGADYLHVIVPEIHCCPGDPDDVSEFLNVNAFNTTGAIDYGFDTMYGDKVDGFHWVRKV